MALGSRLSAGGGEEEFHEAKLQGQKSAGMPIFGRTTHEHLVFMLNLLV
jgi:hypothetical protein